MTSSTKKLCHTTCWYQYLLVDRKKSKEPPWFVKKSQKSEIKNRLIYSNYLPDITFDNVSIIKYEFQQLNYF